MIKKENKKREGRGKERGIGGGKYTLIMYKTKPKRNYSNLIKKS